MTFRDLARACCKQLDQWGYSDASVPVYDRVYLQFLAFLRSTGAPDDVRSFNDRTVYQFSVGLGDQGIHPNTIIKTLSILRTLARYAMTVRDAKDRRLMTEDPTRSFRWPQAQRQETKWAYPEEVRRLVDLDRPTWQAIARDVLVETGIRVGEACRLNVEHFRESEGRYFLAVAVKGRGQKAKRATRDVPISKTLGGSLAAWLLIRLAPKEPDSPLLVNRDGGRFGPTVLSNLISRMGVAAGITRFRLSAHKLRHSKNVRDRQAGIDAATRARLNGHTSLRSQERYDHLVPGELHVASDRSLDQLQTWLGKPPEPYDRAVRETYGGFARLNFPETP